MREIATRVVTVMAVVLVAGCTAGTPTGTAGAPAAGTARTTAPVYGPTAPDAACSAAQKAAQTLQSRQGEDSGNESALDQDFTNFAATLNAAAQHETRPATAQAMTTLANDYTALVESQSGAVQLPDMSQVQKDGAAFTKACSA
jgi:hypothetical protein